MQIDAHILFFAKNLEGYASEIDKADYIVAISRDSESYRSSPIWIHKLADQAMNLVNKRPDLQVLKKLKAPDNELTVVFKKKEQ